MQYDNFEPLNELRLDDFQFILFNMILGLDWA